MVEFRMPSLGADMEAGTLVEWLVKPGDRVKRGDIVAVVETQKGAIEIEIFETGKIEKILVGLNTKVPVGTPLARIRTELEANRSALSPAAAPPAAPAVPLRRRLRCRHPLRRQPPPPVAPGAAARARMSPAARRLAEEHGIDLVDGRQAAVPAVRSPMPMSSAVSARPPLRRKKSARPGSISTRCEWPSPPPWRDRSGRFRIIISSIRSTSPPASNG